MTPSEVAGLNLILLRCFYRARRSRVPREGHFFDVASLMQLVFTSASFLIGGRIVNASCKGSALAPAILAAQFPAQQWEATTW